jgi:AcrR family transcriptional regulator
MADAAGRPETVTLTALAESLQVQLPSLYNHVNGLEDLRLALAIHGSRQLLLYLRQATLGRVGRHALVALCHAYRRFAREHPGLYPLTVRAPDPAEAELVAISQELLQTLSLLLASAGGFKMALDLDESFDRLVTLYLDGLEASTVTPP